MKIDELVNRARIYAFEDGGAELVMGLAWMVTAGGFLAAQLLPNGGYALVGPAIWGGCILAQVWGIKRLKERVTSPRGGYVAVQEQPLRVRGRIVPRALIAALATGVTYLIATIGPGVTLPGSGVAALSALWTVAYGISGARHSMPHLLWLAAFSALLGVWAYANQEGLPFVLFWQGFALAVSGATRLWRFMKAHPKAAETEA